MADARSGTASSQIAQNDPQLAPGNITFVRSFSSADDVRLTQHPALNHAFDIIAGPKDPTLRVDTLQSPVAVAVDSHERVFVADPAARAVHVFDFARGKYALLDGGSDRLRNPVALAVDGQDNLYVVDASSKTVLVYDSAGKFRRYLGRLRGGESYFDNPAGIAIDTTTGHIYVCDTPQHMIFVMDQRGHIVARIGKRARGEQSGEFSLPVRVNVTAAELFVLDVGRSRIQVLDAEGHFRSALNLGYADNRTGLAVDSHGNTYVSDPGLNRIQVFNHQGQTLYSFDPSTIKGATFGRLSALWIHDDHCLYVVDSGNRRVGLFQISGANASPCR